MQVLKFCAKTGLIYIMLQQTAVQLGSCSTIRKADLRVVYGLHWLKALSTSYEMTLLAPTFSGGISADVDHVFMPSTFRRSESSFQAHGQFLVLFFVMWFFLDECSNLNGRLARCRVCIRRIITWCGPYRSTRKITFFALLLTDFWEILANGFYIHAGIFD